MRAWACATAILCLLLAGCSASTPDLLKSDDCTHSAIDEANVSPPSYTRHLDCNDLDGPGRATFLIEYCPFYPRLSVTADHAAGDVEVTVLQDRQEVRSVTLDAGSPQVDVYSQEFDDNRRTEVRIRLSAKFEGDLTADLRCYN